MPDGYRPNEYKYDVFISYSHKDAQWVTKTLVPRLESTGLKVCIDNRDFVAGKAAILNMQDGIKSSRQILLVLSPNWVESQWTNFEEELARVDDPAGIKARTIPLVWKKCKLPDHISMLTWVDFTRNETMDDAWYQLLTSLNVPEEFIRAPRKVHPGRHKNPSRKGKKETAHKVRNLLFFLAAGLLLVVAVVLVAIFSPTLVANWNSTSTATIAPPTGTLLPTETATSTFTATSQPTETVVLDTETPSPTQDPTCIRAGQWFPFTSSASIAPALNPDNCYDLNTMGISLANETYSFYLYGTNRADFYGISSKLSTNTTVTLTVKVKTIREGEFWLGISENENPEQNGVYFVVRDDGLFDIRVYNNGHWSIDSAGLSSPIDTGKVFDLQLKLSGNKLTLAILNGGWSSSPIQVPFSQRMLFIGMRPYATGLVDAEVSDISIP